MSQELLVHNGKFSSDYHFPMDLCTQTPLSGLSRDDYKQGSSQTCQLANYDRYWEVMMDGRPIMAKERAWEGGEGFMLHISHLCALLVQSVTMQTHFLFMWNHDVHEFSCAWLMLSGSGIRAFLK